MKYEIEIKPKAMRDLAAMPASDARRVLARVETLRDGLIGDIKRLTNFTPEYRLRVGDYRALFEVETGKIVVYRVRHRKDVYR